MKKFIVSSIIGLMTVASLQAEDCIMAKELNVQFKNDSVTYANSKELEEIKEYAKFLNATDLHAIVEGHTSSISDARYNFDLSQRRAVKVRAELIALGVPEKKVRAMGFGESSPLYNNNTDEGAAKNRRVIAEVFNSAEELDNYINSQKQKISSIKYKEQ